MGPPVNTDGDVDIRTVYRVKFHASMGPPVNTDGDKPVKRLVFELATLQWGRR